MSEATRARTVLVTGGSGFIGTNIVEALRRGGEQVINLDIAEPRDPAHRSHWRAVDLLDREGVQSLVRSAAPTDVIHLGARTDLLGETVHDYAANTIGTSNLLAALAELDPAPRAVIASTRMVCEIGYQPTSETDFRPPNAYGMSKVECERRVRSAGYAGTWLIVRPTSIWGPWFGVPYRDFFLAVANGRYRHPKGRRVLKSFGYVENTTRQLLGLLAADGRAVHGRLFYLADYRPIEVFEWATQIQEATGARPVRTVPFPALRAVALVGDGLKALGWKEPPLTRFRLRNLVTEMIYGLEPIRGVVPDLPFAADEGVARTVEWLRRDGALPPGGPGR